jgi:hypothetical protein
MTRSRDGVIFLEDNDREYRINRGITVQSLANRPNLDGGAIDQSRTALGYDFANAGISPQSDQTNAFIRLVTVNALGSGGVRASGKNLRDHKSASVRFTLSINYFAAMIEPPCDDRPRNSSNERRVFLRPCSQSPKRLDRSVALAYCGRIPAAEALPGNSSPGSTGYNGDSIWHSEWKIGVLHVFAYTTSLNQEHFALKVSRVGREIAFPYLPDTQSATLLCGQVVWGIAGTDSGSFVPSRRRRRGRFRVPGASKRVRRAQ